MNLKPAWNILKRQVSEKTKVFILTNQYAEIIYNGSTKILLQSLLKVYLERLMNLIQFLNENLFLSLKDYEVHLTIYPEGSFYKKHLDQFNRDDHRKLSVICYLNKDWKESYGGQLRMHLSEKALDFLPLAGRIICFRSDQIEHEVLPATRPRLSLTGWILDQYAELKHL